MTISGCSPRRERVTALSSLQVMFSTRRMLEDVMRDLIVDVTWFASSLVGTRMRQAVW